MSTLICAAGWYVIAAVGVDTPPAATAASHGGSVTRIIPWGEVNHRKDCTCSYCRHRGIGTDYEHWVSGFRYWRSALDDVIITTDPRLETAVPVMESLVAELSPMRIIPGVQPNPLLLNRVDNVEGWRATAETLEKLLEITGADAYVINLETGWKHMREGRYVPDWKRVREGLALLPKHARCIWYPSISCWVDRPTGGPWCSDDLELQTKFLSIVDETLPDVTFVTFEHTNPESAAYEGAIARQRYMTEQFKSPTRPIVYFEPGYWPPEQFLTARDTCPSDVAYFYFGAANWHVCASLGPRALRSDTEHRLIAAMDDVEEQRQRAEAATSLAATMQQRAESAEEALTRLRDLLCESRSEGVNP